MAIIVQHKESRKSYVLIGTGYGAYKSMMPGVLGGSMFPREESAEIPTAAVSDKYGTIHWILTDQLQVVEIDGRPVADYFLPVASRGEESGSLSAADEEDDSCPACGFRIACSARECPSCGLVFIPDEQES
ncbi:hypothetical protein N0M98_18060 [Paenibacillus doosanensis]|uniref:Zinc ribbon domain-containing protein n=1 Tax=Paenibacillus konkukensis TaxID=2020716 RepID=A0ABY4RSM3_9BACL|nr:MULTISPECIES: hypothetical protein [Paenibacillus]MCS7462046.1 hypothetical protein [Paenibacillus doosanensis]UQZ85113.1 hypothetical protein SK3146_04396 [Paenibacillus konkukensis]